ncbi:MAG: restriction endonuclease subunit S [Bauldia sp.]|nr:restriction endonuclease subunit S [Bauldia sp.]
MAGEWPTAELGPRAAKIGSGATPRGGRDAYLADGPFALIRSQNVHDFKFHPDGLAYISDDQAAALASVAVQPNDILVNITGDSVARVCMVDRSILPARVNQHVAIVRAKRDEFDQKFLLYCLLDPGMKRHLLNVAGAGATRNALTKADLERLTIRQPPMEDQIEIGELLGALDEKIELNRRMAETLEAVARTLFKSWFVDFDPVRAKAEGRTTGLPENIAARFPSVLSDAGAPIGWLQKPLGELVEVIEVGSRPKGGVADITQGIPSIGAESIVGMGKHDFSKVKYVPNDFYNSMTRGHVKDRDILIYKDGGKPGVFEPHLTMVGDGFPFDLCAINEHVYRVRASPGIGQNYLFFALSSDQCLDDMRVRGTGVAIPGLNSTQVRAVAVPVASEDVRAAFEAISEGLVRRIFSLCNQSRALAQLRDTLLPKLISGELRIAEAEREASVA